MSTKAIPLARAAAENEELIRAVRSEFSDVRALASLAEKSRVAEATNSPVHVPSMTQGSENGENGSMSARATTGPKSILDLISDDNTKPLLEPVAALQAIVSSPLRSGAQAVGTAAAEAVAALRRVSAALSNSNTGNYSNKSHPRPLIPALQPLGSSRPTQTAATIGNSYTPFDGGVSYRRTPSDGLRSNDNGDVAESIGQSLARIYATVGGDTTPSTSEVPTARGPPTTGGRRTRPLQAMRDTSTRSSPPQSSRDLLHSESTGNEHTRNTSGNTNISMNTMNETSMTARSGFPIPASSRRMITKPMTRKNTLNNSNEDGIGASQNSLGGSAAVVGSSPSSPWTTAAVPGSSRQQPHTGNTPVTNTAAVSTEGTRSNSIGSSAVPASATQNDRAPSSASRIEDSHTAASHTLPPPSTAAPSWGKSASLPPTLLGMQSLTSHSPLENHTIPSETAASSPSASILASSAMAFRRNASEGNPLSGHVDAQSASHMSPLTDHSATAQARRWAAAIAARQHQQHPQQSGNDRLAQSLPQQTHTPVPSQQSIASSQFVHSGPTVHLRRNSTASVSGMGTNNTSSDTHTNNTTTTSSAQANNQHVQQQQVLAQQLAEQARMQGRTTQGNVNARIGTLVGTSMLLAAAARRVHQQQQGDERALVGRSSLAAGMHGGLSRRGSYAIAAAAAATPAAVSAAMELGDTDTVHDRLGTTTRNTMLETHPPSVHGTRGEPAIGSETPANPVDASPASSAPVVAVRRYASASTTTMARMSAMNEGVKPSNVLHPPSATSTAVAASVPITATVVHDNDREAEEEHYDSSSDPRALLHSQLAALQMTVAQLRRSGLANSGTNALPPADGILRTPTGAVAIINDLPGATAGMANVVEANIQAYLQRYEKQQAVEEAEGSALLAARLHQEHLLDKRRADAAARLGKRNSGRTFGSGAVSLSDSQRIDAHGGEANGEHAWVGLLEADEDDEAEFGENGVAPHNGDFNGDGEYGDELTEHEEPWTAYAPPQRAQRSLRTWPSGADGGGSVNAPIDETVGGRQGTGHVRIPSDAQFREDGEPDAIVLRGSLLKRSGRSAKGDTWRPRYCVLTPTALLYYSSRARADADLNQGVFNGHKGGVSLALDDGATATVRVFDAKASAYEAVLAASAASGEMNNDTITHIAETAANDAPAHSFVITPPGGSRRPQIFAAADADALTTWLCALCAVTHEELDAVYGTSS